MTPLERKLVELATVEASINQLSSRATALRRELKEAMRQDNIRRVEAAGGKATFYYQRLADILREEKVYQHYTEPQLIRCGGLIRITDLDQGALTARYGRPKLISQGVLIPGGSRPHLKITLARSPT